MNHTKVERKEHAGTFTKQKRIRHKLGHTGRLFVAISVKRTKLKLHYCENFTNLNVNKTFHFIMFAYTYNTFECISRYVFDGT